MSGAQGNYRGVGSDDENPYQTTSGRTYKDPSTMKKENGKATRNCKEKEGTQSGKDHETKIDGADDGETSNSNSKQVDTEASKGSLNTGADKGPKLYSTPHKHDRSPQKDVHSKKEVDATDDTEHGNIQHRSSLRSSQNSESSSQKPWKEPSEHKCEKMEISDDESSQPEIPPQKTGQPPENDNVSGKQATPPTTPKMSSIQVPGTHSTHLRSLPSSDQNRRIPRLPSADDPDIVEDPTPIYTSITKDLQDKVNNDNFPYYTIVPFFIEHFTKGKTDYSNESHWKWKNAAYVRLPISPLNKSPSTHWGIGGGGRKWDVIVKQLRRLEEACKNDNIKTDFGRVINSVIRAYIPDADDKSNFGMLSRPDLKKGLMQTLPMIVELALSLPRLLSEPLPILKIGESKTIYLSRKLCASLLANAFFCTFPEPSRQLQMPDYNFFRLFNDSYSDRGEVKKEKIKCLLNYFQIISNVKEDFLSEIVSFERRGRSTPADFENCSNEMCDVLVEPDAKIEEADGMLQVDFANKFIGGGVLNDGSVMEEIRFCISPELIVARLFTEMMSDDEVVVITGSQIFSNYTGYSTSFKYGMAYDKVDLDNRPKDNLGRTFTQIVAMDALSFKKYETQIQYQKHYIDRELHKCYVAFTHGNIINPVATGNWGCGAFNGNVELKFLIQWMAASQQKRPIMQYHTVNDKRQGQAIESMTTFIHEKDVKVGQVYKTVLQFQRELERNPNSSLFQFVKDKIEGKGKGGSGDGGGSGGGYLSKFTGGFGGLGYRA